jgi:hypothetical protein
VKPGQALLLAALAATLAAVGWVGHPAEEGEGGEIASAVRHRQDTPTAARPGRLARGSVAQRERPGRERVDRFAALGPDLFPRQDWRPPPPPPEKLLPPPPPPVPPVPYTYVGRWQEGDTEVLFLSQGQQVLNLRKGETAGPWRLDEIRPNQLTFTYLPMDKPQTLRIPP